MDKGKKKIQEEEELFSFFNDYHSNNNTNLSTIPPPPPPDYNILFDGPPAGCLPEEATTSHSLVDEMNPVDKEDFFSTIWSANSFEFPDPPMEQHPMLPESNAGVVPVTRAHEMADPELPISQKLTGEPPRRPSQAPETDKDKPVVFKKTMPPDVLAEVAIIDPKRAQRIVNNRISANKAKEKQKLHTSMLENKKLNLIAKSTELDDLLKFMETEGITLNARNKILKERLEAVLVALNMQEELNDEMRIKIMEMKKTLRPDIPNLDFLIEVYESSSNQDMNVPSAVTTQQLPGIQLQNPPYQVQQAPQIEFPQPEAYIGLENFGVHPNGQGERRSELEQQPPLENPLPYDLYQMQYELAQAHHFQQTQQPQMPELDSSSMMGASSVFKNGKRNENDPSF